MIVLLGQGNGGLLAADANLQAGAARIDAQVLVAQAAHQVEGFPRRLLARESQRVGRHRRLDRASHLGSAAEEAIGRRESVQRLVRTLEVVVLHEERRATLAIVEVGEHRPRQELLPHRLPEALDLAAGLRVVGPALHVGDAVALQLLLEGGRAPPRRVLATLVGEDLARGSIVGDTARERLHHERALLVVRHHEAHQVARVIVHEGRHIDALMASQQEREEIRLPQLIGLGALEALGIGPWARLGGRRFAPPRQALLLQHPAHRRLRGADAEEALHHIANATAARLRLRALHRHDRLAPRIAPAGAHFANGRLARTRGERGSPAHAILLHPLAERRVRNS